MMTSPGSRKTLATRSNACWDPVVIMISPLGSASIPWPAMNLDSSSLSSKEPTVPPYWSISLQSSSEASARILLTSSPGRDGGSYMPPVNPMIFFPCFARSIAARTTWVMIPGSNVFPSSE